MPASYFSHEQKIKTHDQMMETLKARTSSAVGQSPKSLRWLEPVRATQRAENGPYEVRGSRVREGKDSGVVMYWAWVLEPQHKLLGYSADPEIARTFCQNHNLNREGYR